MERFNEKRFLAPESIRSMAAVHAKIKPCGEGILRISDCNRTVKIWNNINNPEERDEMIEKLSRLISTIERFRDAVVNIAIKEETVDYEASIAQ